MANSTGYLPVDPPRQVPPPQSLLSVANRLGRIREGGTLNVTSTDALPEQGEPEDLRMRDGDWTRGLTFREQYCGQGGGLWVPCVATDFDPETRPSNIQYDPPSAAVVVDCSSLTEHDRREVPAAAVDLLNVAQHALVGNEFWRGTIAADEGLPNPSLADNPTVIGSGAVAAIDALAALEEALAGLTEDGCGGGGRSLIHASPQTVTIWTYLGLLRFEGGLILTATDNIVVTGPGYDGSDPDGNIDADGSTAYAYGTGMVDVWLGRPRTLRFFDRDVNDITVQASRPFAAVWSCCHVGIEVNHAERS